MTLQAHSVLGEQVFSVVQEMAAHDSSVLYVLIIIIIIMLVLGAHVSRIYQKIWVKTSGKKKINL